MRQLLHRALLLACLAACGDATVEPLPLQVTITASPMTVAAGATVTFAINAQGGELVQIATDYGDGGSEVYLTGGARTAQLTRPHIYSAAGTFQATSTVTDARAGQVTASVQVIVQ